MAYFKPEQTGTATRSVRVRTYSALSTSRDQPEAVCNLIALASCPLALTAFAAYHQRSCLAAASHAAYTQWAGKRPISMPWPLPPPYSAGVPLGARSAGTVPKSA
jgi:hypothetical protein